MGEEDMIREIRKERRRRIQASDTKHAKNFFKENKTNTMQIIAITTTIILLIFFSILIGRTTKTPGRDYTITNNYPTTYNYQTNKTEYIIRGNQTSVCIKSPDEDFSRCYKEAELIN